MTQWASWAETLPAAFVLLLKYANFLVADSLYLTIRINKIIT